MHDTPFVLVPAPALPRQAIWERTFTPATLEALFESLLGASPALGSIPQIQYLGRYLEALECRGIICESHYVDSEYRAEFAALYSRSFADHGSSCSRLHFFTTETPLQECREWMDRVAAKVGRGATRKEWERASRAMSKNYLGFIVVRPLPRSPIGRSVLRPMNEEKIGRNGSLKLRTTRPYCTHVVGLQLTVNGVAFQQQEGGVAACGAVAAWTAVQVFANPRSHPTTPTDLTILGQEYPSGYRSFPTDSFNLEEMLRAIRGVGFNPQVFPVEENPGLLEALVLLGITSPLPIIALVQQASTPPWQQHAVVLLGGEVKREWSNERSGFGNTTYRLESVYMHDDLLGPYAEARVLRPNDVVEANRQIGRFMRASVEETGYGYAPDEYVTGFEPDSDFVLEVEERGTGAVDFYGLRTLVFVMPPAITVGLDSLIKCATKVVQAADVVHGGETSWRCSYDLRVREGSTYVERLLWDERINARQTTMVLEKLPLPRYVGVVHLHFADRPVADVLVDTTASGRGTQLLAIIEHDNVGEGYSAEKLAMVHHMRGLMFENIQEELGQTQVIRA